MSQSIIDENTKKSLEILNEFIIWGKDIRNLINDLIDHFRNLMVCKVSKDLDEIISLPEESIERLKEQSQNVNINDLIRILNILSETQDSMKSSSNTRILAEVTIMKIAQPMFDESKEALIKRIENLEEKIESGNIKVSTVQIEQSKDVKSQIIEDNKVEENKEDDSIIENEEESKVYEDSIKDAGIKIIIEEIDDVNDNNNVYEDIDNLKQDDRNDFNSIMVNKLISEIDQLSPQESNKEDQNNDAKNEVSVTEDSFINNKASELISVIEQSIINDK